MQPVVVLTGPTGSGKSHIIYSLPENLPIEIINADSRQVYRHMKIGTAMPEEFELKRFAHHLFRIMEPSQQVSAGQYARMCRKAIDEILARNRIPVIVGGTFFYIRALWDGLIENVEVTPMTRSRVEALSKTEAYELLSRLDPERAEKLHIPDETRVKRSLMLILSSNQKIGQLQKTGGVYDSYDFHSFYVDLDRPLLYDRINRRVKEMFEKGLLAEVQNLKAMGFSRNDPGINAIGYKEIWDINDSQGLDLNDWPRQTLDLAMDQISQATRNFAKRQLTWFRNEARLKRIDPVYAVSLLSGLILQYKKK